MRRILIPLSLSILLLVGFGCGKRTAVVSPVPQPPAKTGTLVVLIPHEDGKPGTISVSSRGGSQILDQIDTSTEIPSADSAPTLPKAVTAEEIQKIFGPALQAMPSPAVVYVLHFLLATTSLTEESSALLHKALDTVKQRMPCQVRVVGHTDTMGSDETNDKLARLRAEAVRAKLVEIGVDPALIEVDSYGKRDLLIPTADNVSEPRNRRVEITIR